MLKLAIPLLHVTNTAAAEQFYCNRLGFRREFAHRADQAERDPGYLGVCATESGCTSPRFPGTAFRAAWSTSWWIASMPCTRSWSKKASPSRSSP